MRFRKRAKLFPGVYINFSKSGISTTIGVPGASINFGKNGTYLNTGIPGTGLYDRTRIDSKAKNKEKEFSYDNEIAIDSFDEKEIKSNKAETTTSEGLNELKKTLIECYEEKNRLRLSIVKANTDLGFSMLLLIISYMLIFGFFIKWFKEDYKEKKEELQKLKDEFQNCFVNVDMELDSQYEVSYEKIHEKFVNLTSCSKIWDVTSTASVDRYSTRSAAEISIKRTRVKFDFKNIDIIKSKYKAMHLQNANGGDLYLYPTFLAIVEGNKKFGLIDIRELDFYFHGQRFLEEEGVPKDAEIIEYTWAKVNRNGGRDKRFKDNYQIPICNYGEMEFNSATGLNESYSFSSFEKSNNFSNALNNYLDTVKSPH